MKENVFLTFDSWERIEMLWCVVCASLSSKYEFALIWRVSLAIIYRSCLPSHIMINFNQKSFKQNVFNVKKKVCTLLNYKSYNLYDERNLNRITTKFKFIFIFPIKYVKIWKYHLTMNDSKPKPNTHAHTPDELETKQNKTNKWQTEIINHKQIVNFQPNKNHSWNRSTMDDTWRMTWHTYVHSKGHQIKCQIQNYAGGFLQLPYEQFNISILKLIPKSILLHTEWTLSLKYGWFAFLLLIFLEVISARAI